MSDAGTNENQNDKLQKTKKQLQSTRKMLSLMKQLSEIQISNGIMSTAIFSRQKKEQVEEKVTQMKDKIIEQAKPYGKKAQAVAEVYMNNKQKKENIIQQYKESLEAIEKEYQERVEYVVTNRRKFEEAEQESAAKELNLRNDRRKIAASTEYVEHLQKEEEALKKLDEALKQDDMDVILARKDEYEALKEQNPITKCSQAIKNEEERRKKIQDVLTMCDDVLVKCEEDRTNTISEATSDKNNKLAVIEKQPIMKRIVGSIFYRINGAKKFTKDVIERVQETNYHINDEVLPAIKERMSEGVDKAIDAINEKGKPLVERGKRAWDKTKERGTQFVQNRREDWEYIKEAKEQMMQKLEANLVEAIERGEQLNTISSVYYAEMKAVRTERPMAYDDSVYEETDR